uniref:Uncharacterized protein n=1 Tax=Anguilla anguilla TaxID=7936 RepID=A0A0E9VM57_ANGAN
MLCSFCFVLDVANRHSCDFQQPLLSVVHPFHMKQLFYSFKAFLYLLLTLH